MEESIDILIIGGYGQPNFGDDLLMIVIDNILHENHYNYKFLLPHNTKGYAENYIDDYLYNDHDINTNILLFGGGTQFYQFKYTAMNARKKLIFKFIKNPFLLLKYFVSKFKTSNISLKSKKKIGIGIGIGPFEGNKAEEKKIQVRNHLSNFDLLIVRDKVSYNFLNNTHANFYMGSDLCFVSESYLPFKTKIVTSGLRSEMTFIIRDWPHSKDIKHIDSVISFIKQNDKTRIKVVLFANDTYCENTLKKYNIEYIKWDPFKYTIQQFLNIVYDTELIISSRYHGCVLSTLFSVPFISISVDTKLSIFSNDVYNKEMDWAYPYDIEKLKSIIKVVQADKEDYQYRINNSVIKLRNQMEEPLNILIKYFSDEAKN